MRDFGQFTGKEWLRGKPLEQGFKQLRDNLFMSAYLRQRPPELEKYLAGIAHLRGRNVALVVAFESPWVLGWLARMAKRQFGDTTLLVFDNSRTTESRAQIAQVCAEHGVPYLGLPPNRTRHANRSHGRAMTWIYHNVVRALQPEIFAYLDHDLIPMEPIDFAATLGDQPFYGLPNVSTWGWNLWAGYCIYRYALLGDAPLNFLHDFSRGLDTGGRNWPYLYKHHDRARLRFAFSRLMMVDDPVEGVQREVEVVERRWVHLRGVSYNDNLRPIFKFYERMAKEAEAGATLKQLLPGSGF